MSDVSRLRLDVPRLEIEWAASAEETAALLRRVQEKWSRLGRMRPHWSVNADAAFLPDSIGANQAAFDRSGEADLARLLAVLRRHGDRDLSRAHVCDFGCGVGRVTLPMAARFGRVTGCDISSPHMLLGRIEAARRGCANVVFSLVNDVDFGMTEPFDLWYSHLVLQHNPPPVMALILMRMFALLAPGGLACFQLPTYRVGYSFRAATALAAPPEDEDFEIHALPQEVVFRLARASGCEALEVREDDAVWPPSLAISNMFVFSKPDR